MYCVRPLQIQIYDIDAWNQVNRIIQMKSNDCECGIARPHRQIGPLFVVQTAGADRNARNRAKTNSRSAGGERVRQRERETENTSQTADLAGVRRCAWTLKNTIKFNERRRSEQFKTIRALRKVRATEEV